MIFQTVGADELTVKFLQIVFAKFSATDGADVFVFVHSQNLHKMRKAPEDVTILRGLCVWALSAKVWTAIIFVESENAPKV